MTNQERFEQQLKQATEGMELENQEQDFLSWIARWDAWTVDNLCSIIGKCREGAKNES